MKDPRPSEPVEPSESDKPGKSRIDQDDAQLEDSEEDPFDEEDRDTAKVSE